MLDVIKNSAKIYAMNKSELKFTVDYFLADIRQFESVIFLIEMQYEANTGKELECDLIKGIAVNKDPYSYYDYLSESKKQVFKEQFRNVKQLVIKSQLLLEYEPEVHH